MSVCVCVIWVTLWLIFYCSLLSSILVSSHVALVQFQLYILPKVIITQEWIITCHAEGFIWDAGTWDAGITHLHNLHLTVNYFGQYTGRVACISFTNRHGSYEGSCWKAKHFRLHFTAIACHSKSKDNQFVDFFLYKGLCLFCFLFVMSKSVKKKKNTTYNQKSSLLFRSPSLVFRLSTNLNWQCWRASRKVAFLLTAHD